MSDKIKTEEDFKKKIEEFLDSIPEDIIKEYAIYNFDLKEESDIIDSNRLEEIKSVFINGSFIQRENMYNLIIGL